MMPSSRRRSSIRPMLVIVRAHEKFGVVLSLVVMPPPAETDPLGEQLEPALETLDTWLAEAARSLKGATLALKNAHDAARTGNLRELKRLLAAVAETAEAYLREVRRTEALWEFSAEEYLASDQY